MNLRIILPFIVSLVAAKAAANPSTGQIKKTVDPALQRHFPLAGGAHRDAAGENVNLPSSKQQGEHPPVPGVKDGETAAAESSNTDYNYSSAFERITRHKADEPGTLAPVFEEKEEPFTPEPPNTQDLTEDEIAEDEEVEIESDVELLPLNTFLQREHFEALGDFVGSLRQHFDLDVHNNISEESKFFATKVKAQRSSIGRALDSVLEDKHTEYFRPVHAKRLQGLQLLGFADQELHNRRAHLADAQGLPYVPKRWATPLNSEEVMKLKRGALINHGFASATYAVRRILPYNKSPGRTLAETEGALKVFIVKRKTISEDLAEEVLEHQCRAWKALPPERSEELAENGHLLYPVSVLKMIEDKNGASTSKARKAAGVSKSNDPAQTDVLSDLLNGKILNLFLLYPRAYECTLKYFIASRGRTDLLSKIAPMKVMISISIQMIYAVAQLNSYGLVHTKIRPNSFVITGDGKVLLTDLYYLTESGTRLDCFHQSVPMALDINSAPEEALCTDRVPGYTYEASLALDAWRTGVALYKLWCRESWDPTADTQKWKQELERRRRFFQARTTEPFKSVQHYTRHKLALQHCRKDTPSFILRLIQQFLEPNPTARLTALDAVRGSSLFMYMKRKIKTAQAILEKMKQDNRRRREEL